MVAARITVDAAGRRNDIDWLRIAAVALLIPFHTARVFDYWEIFYVKNAELSWFLSYFISFVHSWHMPLLFLLAGASSGYALNFRTARQFSVERLKRLGLPFIFGLLVIVPPQSYISLLREGAVLSFWRFYPGFFRIDWSDLSGYYGKFSPAHLWFILFLVIISLFTLPLLQHLRSVDGKRFITKLEALLIRPGAIFLTVIPLTLAEAFPALGDKNILYFIVAFLYGYILFTRESLQVIVERYKFFALLCGLIMMPLIFVSWPWFNSFADFSGPSILYAFIRNLNTWSWLLAILGYGARYLNGSNGVLTYARDAVYPFYILHQTVIVAVAFLIVPWDVAVWLKFTVILLVSFILTIMLYDLLVKRFNLMRLFFGLKPKQIVVTGEESKLLAPVNR